MNFLAAGLGAAGGRLAGELARRGQPAIAMHTSRRARETQAHIPKDRCVALGDSSVDARALIREQATRLQQLMYEQSRGVDFVLLLASLGDPVGAAVGELVRLVDRPDTKVVTLVVLPTESEPTECRARALRTVQELTDLALDGLMLIDGRKLAGCATGASILEFGPRADECLATWFDGLDRLVHRDDVRPVHAVTPERTARVMTHGGVIAMGACALSELTPSGVTAAVDQVLGDGEMVLGGLHVASASAMQIVIEAPQSVLRATPAHTLQQVREELKAKSPGLDLGLAVYLTTHDVGPSAVHVMASCAALPASLHDIVEDVAHEAAAIRDKPRCAPRLDLSILGDGEVAEDSGLRGEGRANDDTHRLAVCASDVAPRPVVETHHRTPNATVYARLVSRYKATQNEELQRTIARRLEQDRTAQDPRVRILAVSAMAQIGAEVFNGSLIAATEDESPQVRLVAERALASGNPTRRAV